jgi:putative hydrolase of the HAD superfamily
MYDAVLFDAAETLFTTRGTVGEIYAEAARLYGSEASAAEIDAAFSRQFQHSGPTTRDGERQWWKDVVHRVFLDVGMVPDFDAFFEDVYTRFRNAQGWRLFPDTLGALEQLKSGGFRLGVVSNFDSRVYAVLESLKIRSFFQAITISSEAGYAKPHPKIFEAAVRAAGAPAHRTLYAGDSLMDDYQAGEAAGLHTVLVDRAGRYRRIKSIRRIESLHDISRIVG